MIRRAMAQVDVKAGISSILSRIEAAYAARSKVFIILNRQIFPYR